MWRVGTLAPQLGTLGHTEAVLFVDNDHSQAGKLHSILNDGMRANEYLYGTVE